MSINDQSELLKYAFQYIRLNDLINELNAEIKAKLSDTSHLNVHVRFLIRHPSIADQSDRICTLLLDAQQKEMLDEKSRIEIAQVFPSISGEMITMNSKVLSKDSQMAFFTALKYPDMFFANIEICNINVAISTLLDPKIMKQFQEKKYKNQMAILGILFTKYKNNKLLMENLFSIIKLAEKYISKKDNCVHIAQDDILALLSIANSEQYLHHVLLAWNCKLINDDFAILYIGRKPISTTYHSKCTPELSQHYNKLLIPYLRIMPNV
jgi:hypothetical protein